MQVIRSAFATICIAAFSSASCMSQHNTPVSWTCQWNHISGNEGVIVVTASLSPGWHLYSQHIAEGGPIPTQLKFVETPDFELTGKPKEEGSPFTYYDSLYEMKITWYSYEVGFMQKIRLNKTESIVQGEAVFMICNEDQCIPMREKFMIPVAARPGSP